MTVTDWISKAMRAFAVCIRLSVLLLAGWLLAACTPDEMGYGPKHLRPVSAELRQKIKDMNMASDAPILVRIFKQESQLEVWKQTRTGRYALLTTFDICSWSGKLGPKIKEGDRQAPEGFYTIRPAQMNPKSSYYLAFNMGFPNAFDRSHGRTGSHLMVHGACSSRGCYAMTDEQIQDIYALARDAFRGGQRAFEVHAFPFHMTPENMAKHRSNPNYAFWKMLKEGYDHFEVTKLPPKIDVCAKRYVFNAKPEIPGASFRASAGCPSYTVPPQIAVAVDTKEKKDDELIEQLVVQLAEKKKREKEQAEAARKRQEMIAKLLGSGREEADKGAAGADTLAGDRQAATASGTPVPRPSPQKALALRAQEKSETGSFFSSIFGGEEKAAPVPPAPVDQASTSAGQPSGKMDDVPADAMRTPGGSAVRVPVAKTTIVAPAAREKKSGSMFSRIFGN